MKVKTFALAAGTATAMLLAGTATADLNLTTELHGSWEDGGVQYDVYRLYSQGTQPHIIGAWGNPIGDWSLTNTNADNTGNGSGFWAFGFAGVLPQLAGNTYNLAPDAFDNSSFLTIGVEPGDPSPGDVFQLIPGTDTDFHGNPKYTDNGGGVATAPGQPNTFSVEFGENDHRILLAQFTVVAGENVKGEGILIAWQNEDGVPQDDLMGLSFSTKAVPAPGAIALLGLAGLVGTRRRRA